MHALGAAKAVQPQMLMSLLCCPKIRNAALLHMKANTLLKGVYVNGSSGSRPCLQNSFMPKYSTG